MGSGAGQHLKQYLGAGLAALLALAALFVPQGWFALRDEALADHVQGEALSPLMVAQLDHSYEQDLHERMSACLAAVNAQDVLCSSKEMEPDSEAVWENIGQAERNLLMEALEWNVVHLMIEDEVLAVESCMQYALIRQSDGALLLVANDIRLCREDGSYMELLLDGVDGTVYYLESEGNPIGNTGHNWRDNMVEKCAQWWQILNIAYETEEIRLEDVGALSDRNGGRIEAYNTYDGLVHSNELTVAEEEALDQAILLFSGDERAKGWYYVALDDDYNDRLYTYCCLLAFGELADSWTMEMELGGKNLQTLQRIRMGLPWVVSAIPDMAERISLTEYRDIYRLVGLSS